MPVTPPAPAAPGGVVLLCPGQGQVPRELGALVLESGADLSAAYAARLGADAHLDAEADPARLQAALVAVGIGRGRRALACLEAPAVRKTYGPLVGIAGHSLGELTALALAGALEPAVAIGLAADRGAAVQAHHEARSWGDAGMMAISGPAVQEHIEGLLASHGGHLANDNAGDQVVVSASGEALVGISADARELGLRAVRLETTHPSHSPILAPVVPVFRASVEAAPRRAPSVPVISGLTAAPFTDLPTELSTILAEPVRWREALLALAATGPAAFLDIGPTSAMARLARKTVAEIPALTLDDLEAAA